MRIAVVADIHDNLTAFEAVVGDLRNTSPDLVLHGGDLVVGGSSPREIVDQIRDLRWPGVMGNTDEAVVNPASLEEFAAGSQAPSSLWEAVREMTAFAAEALGEDRIEWLRTLPRQVAQSDIVLVHASPSSMWKAPGADAADAEQEATYASLGKPVAIYGHIHSPFVRELGGFTLINAGSVGQSFDGDPRASYLLLDNGQRSIRRVAYDVEKEIRLLATSGLPRWEWAARTLRAARPQSL